MFSFCNNIGKDIEIEDIFKKKDNFPETFDNAIKYKNGIIFIYESDKKYSIVELFSNIKKDKELIDKVINNFTTLIVEKNEKEKYIHYLEYEVFIDEAIYFIIKEKKNKSTKSTTDKIEMNIDKFKNKINELLTDKKVIESKNDSTKKYSNEFLNDNINNNNYKFDVFNHQISIDNINNTNDSYQNYNKNNNNSFQNYSIFQNNNEYNINKISNLNQNIINCNNNPSSLNNINILNYQNNNSLENNSINNSDINIKKNYQSNFGMNGIYNSELYYNELISNDNFNFNNLNQNSNYFNNINKGFSKENNILIHNSNKSINESYNGNNNNMAKIIFRFPSLKRVNKTFNKYDKIELMFDFINSLGDEIFKELKQKSFIFSQPFPNKFFTLKDKEQTFYEAELWPEGIIDIIPDKKK
jgi:hypothetical protein